MFCFEWGYGVFGGYTSICDGGGGGPWHAYTPPSLGVGTRGIRGQIGAIQGQIDPQNPTLTYSRLWSSPPEARKINHLRARNPRRLRRIGWNPGRCLPI